MSRIKRHHTVPCSYLKGFVNTIDKNNYRRSIIEVYDREKNEYRSQPINDTTVIKDFYTVKDENGKKVDILEKALGQEVDSKIGKIIDKIENDILLSNEEKSNLFLFVAFQKQRTQVDVIGYKETEEEFKKFFFMSKYQYGGLHALKDTFKKIGLDLNDKEIKEHYNFIINGEWDIKITDNGYLMKQMMQKIAITYDFLMGFKYVIFKASKGRHFITSDDPYCMVAPKEKSFLGGVGFLTPGLEIHIPLSKNRCLFLTNGDKLKVSGYYNIPTDLLRNLNKRTCANSYRYVLSHNKKLLKNLVKQTKIEGLGEFKHKISTPLSRANKNKLK